MTISVPLTQGKFALISDEDAVLAKQNWHAHSARHTYYAERKKHDYKGIRILKMHRVVMERVIGRKLADDEFIDHIDGDGLNNTRENLRIVDVSENLANSKVWKNNSSGYRGVSYHKRNKRWQAKIHFKGKLTHLGWYDTPEEASRAYERGAREIFGEFKRDEE